MAQWRVTIRGTRVEGRVPPWTTDQLSYQELSYQEAVAFIYQKDFALDDTVARVRDLGMAAAESHGVQYSLIEKVELVYTDPRGVAG